MQKLVIIILSSIGILLLLIGVVAAYYGPLEIFVFYLFSEGGRFYYDGFGAGSFWFTLLMVQNIGYYMIAAVCLPVGIGHLKLRRWTLTLTQLFTWFWLVAGILLAANLTLLIPQAFELELSRDLVLTRLTIIGSFVVFILILLPILVLRFNRSEKVRSVFEENDPNIYWSESYPFPLLALLLLFAIMIFLMHLAIFF